VLINRGISPNNIQHYLNTTDSDILDPNMVDNMHEGARMLVSHIGQNHKIHIQVDSDCDGYTSAAILINYLNCICPSFVQNNISYSLHKGKQHGIDTAAFDADVVALVIAPDSSSNEYEIHQSLQEEGIDVLIIDHHEAPEASKYACVINNQLCDYPTKSLSGAGMVYKFCCYLDNLLQVDYASRFLDLVALALVADMMDLRDYETKHLINLGINQIQNPYLKGMVEKQAFALGDTITPKGLAFYVAPFINAVTRTGTMEEKLILFEAMLEFKAYEQLPSTKRGCHGMFETRVEQACRNCTNIKNRQTRTRDASLEIIEHIIETKQLLNNKILVIKLDQDHTIDKNLTGLIANELMSKYQRPVLLLNQVIDNGKITWEGSGRGYDKSKLRDFRGFLEGTRLIEYAEGHANAFGAGIADDKFNEFITTTNQLLQSFDFSPSYKVDFIYNAKNINNVDILTIADYKELWGQGLDEPLIAIEGINITKDDVFLMKRNTLKINVPSSDGMSLIQFGSSDEEYDSLYSPLGCVTINIVGKCERNSWDNKPQIKLVDYEIVRRTEYYF
jgi:single-stranded-DNA-specific exonuclease